MIERLVARYAELPVPRYTSYPTAVDFSPAIGPAQYAGWLNRLVVTEGVSLYLHVPYCRALCHYCGCHTKATIRQDVITAYQRMLEKEIALVGAQLPGRLPVSHLHWGGGTPSMLGIKGLAIVRASLERYFDFADGYEHAIELDPRAMDKDFAHGLAALGVNRASLGVQDLDPRVQQAIGRLQPLATVAAATESLRAAGIEAINFDLLYGLPHQTLASINATAREVIALAPDRIAAFGYAHLPARRANQRLIDAATLPDVATRFAQARTLALLFAEAGYDPIGIDHFARPQDSLSIAARTGRLHRNFQGYTDDTAETVIGIGASAISRLPEGYGQNVADIAAYRRCIDAGKLATRRGIGLTDGDRLRGKIIEQLMCMGRVDLAAYGRVADFSAELDALQALRADGLITIDAGLIAVTESGQSFVRVAAAVFDRYRGGEQKFSKAV